MLSALRSVVSHFLHGQRNRVRPKGCVRTARPEVEELGERIMLAASVWSGLAMNNNASAAANWDAPPGGGDSLIFDGTRSNKDAVIDPAFLASVGKVTIQGGYTGTVTIGRAFTATEVVEGSGSVAVGMGLEFHTQKYTLTDGKISGPGILKIDVGAAPTMTMAGGTLDSDLNLFIAATTTVTVSADVVWSAATISNFGTVNWTGGNIATGTGSFNNYGTFNILSNAELGTAGTPFKFDNFNRINKNTAVGTTHVETPLRNIKPLLGPTPVLSISTGKVELLGTGQHTVSVFLGGNAQAIFHNQQNFVGVSEILGGGTALFDGQNEFAQGSTLTSGAILKKSGGFFEGVAVGAGTLINNGRLEWSDGTMRNLSGFVNNGILAIQDSNVPTTKELVDTTLQNFGLVEWTGLGNISLQRASIVNRNQGTFDVQTDAMIEVPVGAIGAFTNQGTFTKTFGDGTTTCKAPFTNTGTVLLNGRDIDFQKGFSQTNANAVFRLGGGDVTVAAGFEFDIAAGLLSGTGTINGNLRLSGNLDFGPTIGGMVVTGNYTQTATGTIRVKVGGNGNADCMSVSGAANLAGSVAVQLVNGYMPVAGTHSSPFMTVAGGIAGALTPPPGWTVVNANDILRLNF